MDMIHDGFRGLSLLIGVNFDRLFFAGAIVLGLMAGAILGSALTGM